MNSSSNGKPVTVRLQSVIRHPGQPEDKHEFMASGTFLTKAGQDYLRFEEDMNGQAVRTTVKLGEEDAIIMRSGAVNMRLPLGGDGFRLGSYGSGPASFNLHVRTKTFSHSTERPLAGALKVTYELHDGEALLGTYTLHITYTEGKR